MYAGLYLMIGPFWPVSALSAPGGRRPGRLLFKSPFSKNQLLMWPSGSFPPFFTMMNGAKNCAMPEHAALRCYGWSRHDSSLPARFAKGHTLNVCEMGKHHVRGGAPAATMTQDIAGDE